MSDKNMKNQIRPITRNLSRPAPPRFSEVNKSAGNLKTTFKTSVLAFQSVKKVKITHYEKGPFMFYVQLESSDNDFKKFSEKLQKAELRHFKDSPNSIGLACLAKHEKQIYRAAIAKIPQNSSQSNFYVNFVDFGYNAFIKEENLFHIPEEFADQTTFAIPFCLNRYDSKDMQASPEELQFYFRLLTENQMMTLKCVPSDGPPISQYCELFDDNKISIYEKLKRWNPYSNELKFLPQPKLDLKTPLKVKVSYVDSTKEFYVHVQQPDIVNAYDSLCDDLFKFMCHAPLYRYPKVGSCCAAFLSEEWYRVQIVGIKNNIVQVKVVDFGIVEEVTPKQVRLLPEYFFKDPPFAHQAFLKGFENMEISDNISTQFDIFCGDGTGERKTFKMTAHEIVNNSYSAELEDTSVMPSVNVNKLLLKNSRPLIETIQLENAMKRQKDSSKKDGRTTKATSNDNLDQNRGNNSTRGGPGINFVSKGSQRNNINSQSDTSKMQQSQRTHFGKVIRNDGSASNTQKSPDRSNVQKQKNDNQKSGWVSTLLSINTAFVHYDEHIEGLEKILDEMFAFYENKNSRPVLKDPQIGMDCATRSNDGNWYRSRIGAFQAGDKIKVFHREYGNSEIIHKSKVRVLDDKFVKIGDLVVECFFLIKPNDPNDKYLFNEMLKIFENGAKEFTFKVVQPFKSGFIIEPIDQITNKNVIDELIKRKKAQKISLDELEKILNSCGAEKDESVNDKAARKSPEKRKKNNKIASKPIEKSLEVNQEPEEKISLETTENVKEEKVAVKITAITSPTDFYISRVDDFNAFKQFHADIQIIASNASTLKVFEEGTLCLAKQPFDSCWYRAKIIDNDENDQNIMVTVRSVDDGKTFSVDDKCLKVMPNALEERKFFGILCSLPVRLERKNEDNATTMMITLMDNVLHSLFVCKQRMEKKCYIDLFVESESLTEKLIQNGFAHRLDTIEDGRGYTSHINSLSSFYLQFEIDQLKLDLISQYFEETKGNFEKIDGKEGDIVAALFPDDNCWYRSKIESIEDKSFMVKFIDFGNVCLVEKIGLIAEQTIIELPAMSKHCCLSKPKGIKDYSEAAEKKFIEICDNGATIVNVSMVEPGNPVEIDISVDGKNIAEDLMILSEPFENNIMESSSD
ncbi:CLUMA_CG006466, isoform A [Clunio marinus]|uniref:CLUMA_CG006466, isoform A n=1 Tax=Clunio marinus TaxID=568069 RepID=A0A1J1HYB8_9DIPT|nr:CLUMA_CG006466, isoform A [Clunio marinus]